MGERPEFGKSGGLGHGRRRRGQGPVDGGTALPVDDEPGKGARRGNGRAKKKNEKGQSPQDPCASQNGR